MNKWECHSCGKTRTGEPAAEVDAVANINFKKIPVIVDDDVESELSEHVKVCGSCIAELAPFITLDISMNGSIVNKSIKHNITVNNE